MSDFTFSSTAECDVCGNYLSSEDEECDHDGQEVRTRIFRRLNEGRESLTGVKSVHSHKWHDLREKVGEDWIAYQYLGTRDHVTGMLESSMWDGVDELPHESTSLDAPDDVDKDE